MGEIFLIRNFGSKFSSSHLFLSSLSSLFLFLLNELSIRMKFFICFLFTVNYLSTICIINAICKPMLLPLPNDPSFVMSIQSPSKFGSLYLNRSSIEEAPRSERISKEKISIQDIEREKILSRDEILLKISEICQAVQSNLIQAKNNEIFWKEEMKELEKLTQEMGNLLVSSRPRYG